MHIGIDVGGTNTDAVIMDGRRVVGSIKAPTTKDVTGGITTALRGLLEQTTVLPGQIRAVAIGTTHFTNAVVQARDLAPTAAIRLGLPASAGVPPMTGWPEHLRVAMGGHVHLCHGGHEFDGREISPLDEDEIKGVAASMAAADITSAAVTSIFSPVNHELEVRVAELLRAELPHVRVSLSHEVGRIGLLERENATIINASLLPVADRITGAFTDALARLGIAAPLYLSQNDGTLMDVDHVRRYPVATFAAGPTNSMRGAALLSGLEDCVVADIGGTTTDVGAVVAGFPRPATTEVDLAGVRTNFRMPDVVSVGIGGGSLVDLGAGPGVLSSVAGYAASAGGPAVGPRSVGYRLTQEALVFGGSTLTATDIAVAAGLADLGDRALVAHLDRAAVVAAAAVMSDRVGALAETMRTSRDQVPLVLVGGGSVLMPERIPGFDTVVRPPESAVANAIGAAIAQVGGEVDRVYSLDGAGRERILDEARAEAVSKAIEAGADPATVAIVEVDELPIAYLPGNATRVRVKAIGELSLDQIGERRP